MNAARGERPCVSPLPKAAKSVVRPVTPVPPPSPLVLGVQHQTPSLRLPGWRPNGTRDWLLIYTLAGEGEIRVKERVHGLWEGDALLIAPNTPQEYGLAALSQSWSNLWAHFRPPLHWLPLLDWPELSHGTMLLSLRGEHRGLVEAELRRALSCQSMPGRFRAEAAANALERVLFLSEEANPNSGTTSLDPRIAAAVRYMGENLGRDIAIGELSRLSGLSRSRFTVLFSGQLNMSPQAYLEAARLGRAAQLLRASRWSIGEVAEEVGYPDQFYFSTRFRRYFGTSPTLFRIHGGQSVIEERPSAQPFRRKL